MTIKPRYAESLPDPSGAPMLAVFYHLTGAHAMLCIAEAAADTAIIIERVSWDRNTEREARLQARQAADQEPQGWQVLEAHVQQRQLPQAGAKHGRAAKRHAA